MFDASKFCMKIIYQKNINLFRKKNATSTLIHLIAEIIHLLDEEKTIVFRISIFLIQLFVASIPLAYNIALTFEVLDCIYY